MQSLVTTPPPRMTEPSNRDAIAAALARSVAKLAPLWPLEQFVAVNPFVGFADHDLEAASIAFARSAGARLTMPRSFYAEAFAAGEIDADDLLAALSEVDATATLEQVFDSSGWAPEHARRVTVADVATERIGGEWSAIVGEAISSWAAGYFDQGHAGWRSPWRELSPFAAWRAEAALDRRPELRGPELRGPGGVRAQIAELPDDPLDACAWAIAQLGLTPVDLDAQLDRLAMTIAGWAGYARYRSWPTILRGEPDTVTTELLAIRLVWDAILLATLGPRGVEDAWQARDRGVGQALDARALTIDLALHRAYERGVQRRLLGKLRPRPAASAIQRFVQAVFCIDVRSEPIRRTLEVLDVGIETRGFAGFFAVAVEYVALADQRGGPRCPVLIEPSVIIGETVADPSTLTRSRTRAGLHKAGASLWSSVKQAAVASFGYVETTGLGYAPKLVSDSLGLTRPVPSPTASLGRATALRPDLAVSVLDGRELGLPHARRVEIAANMLRAMSLTRDFAPLVVLFGHGSTSVNNPHATGLDCGACGGHHGDANARIAAAILNDPHVRSALREQDLVIPDETWFLAGVHDTTTDELELFDLDEVPASHAWELRRLQTRLRAAAPLARAERAPKLGLTAHSTTDAAVLARSRDWSQIRPELGLAGCAAMIVGPRALTRGLDLEGRVFLHDYDWRRDPGCATLTTIMTAPMIVASWISLQYYASTVDNRVFGCGDKTLHDVVGLLGVLEGRGGELRVGLPWQAVHDGQRLLHAPVRLSVVIAAPVDAIDQVLDQHASVRQLVDNGWLQLFTMADSGEVSRRYLGQLRWTPEGQSPLGLG